MPRPCSYSPLSINITPDVPPLSPRWDVQQCTPSFEPLAVPPHRPLFLTSCIISSAGETGKLLLSFNYLVFDPRAHPQRQPDPELRVLGLSSHQWTVLPVLYPQNGRLDLCSHRHGTHHALLLVPCHQLRVFLKSHHCPLCICQRSRDRPRILTSMLSAVLDFTISHLLSSRFIHDFYNVLPVPFRLESDGSIPHSVEMPLLRMGENRPTHALAIMNSAIPFPSIDQHSPHHVPPSPSSEPPSPTSPISPSRAEPYLLPIDGALFSSRFGHSVARSLTSGLAIHSAAPLTRWDRSKGVHLVTLLLIPLYVPHPPSIPHILLFGQGLPLPPSPSASANTHLYPPSHLPRSRSSSPTSRCASPSARLGLPSTLTPYLLPAAAIAEFPAAPAMAAAMARHCTPASLRAHAVFNQGIWRNVLLLAPTDPTLVDTVRVAWNVAADARRLAVPALSPSSTSPPPLPPIPVDAFRGLSLAPATAKKETVYLAPVVPSREIVRQRSREVVRRASREVMRRTSKELMRQASREAIRQTGREIVRQRSYRDLRTV